jgi:methionyl-tRNA formyltransferase
MDAGPILKQWSCPDDGTSSSEEVQYALFEQGTKLLLGAMPKLWEVGSGREEMSGDGTATKVTRTAQYINQHHAIKQDAALATHAPKLSKKEGDLSLRSQSPLQSTAAEIHCKVRAFSEIGVWARIQLVKPEAGETGGLVLLEESEADCRVAGDQGGEKGKQKKKKKKGKKSATQRLRLVRTRMAVGEVVPNGSDEARMSDDSALRQQQLHLSSCGTSLLLTCGAGLGQQQTLEVLEVQVEGKAVTSAKSFWNGMQGRRVYWLEGTQRIQTRASE